MCEAWDHDDPADLPTIQRRLSGLIREFARRRHHREKPTVALAQHWHREVYQGLNLPEPYYAGEIRDTDPRFPCLIGYEVRVRRFFGLNSAHVPAALARFERQLQGAIADADRHLPAAQPPGDVATLQSLIALMAAVHGEWIRIHPFANGNGRTARLWANWCALRYELPPFVTTRRRPAHPDYVTAADASMAGNHAPMVSVFSDLLRSYGR